MRRFLLSTLSAVALLAACGPAEDLTSVPAAVFDEATTAQLTSNPLLAEWTGPNGGQPAFDKMDLAQLKPAVEAGIAQSWHKLVGDTGEIVSLEHYGESADAETLFREFGFTAEAVVDAAERTIHN